MAIPTLHPYSPKPTQEQQLERGRIAVLEQMKIFRQIFTVTGKPQASRTRGEVAAQEQRRIFLQYMSDRTIQHREPKMRGEVAAQEQWRILSNILPSL